MTIRPSEIGGTAAYLDVGTGDNDIPLYSDLRVKAWATFNSAGVITDSFNVSSITDIGTGNWSPNFTTPITTGYTVFYGNDTTTSTQTSYGAVEVTTSQCNVRSYVAGGLADNATNYVLVISN